MMRHGIFSNHDCAASHFSHCCINSVCLVRSETFKSINKEHRPTIKGGAPYFYKIVPNYRKEKRLQGRSYAEQFWSTFFISLFLFIAGFGLVFEWISIAIIAYGLQ